MLPEGWKKVPLHEIAEIRTGLAKGKTDLKDPVELPYLRVANVQDGRVDLREVKTIMVERANIERYALQDGDILMTEGGDFDKLGRGDVWRGQIPMCLHQNHVFAVRPDPDKLDSNFLAALAASQHGRNYFLSCAKRSTNLASINASQLKVLPVLMPQFVEQKRIALVLLTWDDAIISVEQLLANMQKQKQALVGRLLRLQKQKKSAVELSFFDLDSLFERVVRKNAEGNDNVLTISGEHGLISQRDYFNKSVASDNLSGYTLIRKGEFAYNKSYSNGYPMGAIKPLQRYEAGVVSSLYICFRIRDDVEADFDFFRHYFEAGLLNEALMGVAQEGARNHGLLNVSVGDFFKLRLQIPSIKEQRRIAAILNAADAEVDLIARQLAALRTEKQALMQQLLTGKRRVTLPATAKPPLAKPKPAKSTTVRDRRK
jgi:type I restriction enzyme S subunit